MKCMTTTISGVNHCVYYLSLGYVLQLYGTTRLLASVLLTFHHDHLLAKCKQHKIDNTNWKLM